jgi:hypothetical protein
VIDEVPDDCWQEREQYWIEFYRMSGEPLTNLTDGGDGLNGLVFTEEHRRKLSAVLMGHRGTRPVGIPCSEETKRKISQARKGKFFPSPETRRKISEAGKGRKHSETTKNKIKLAVTKSKALAKPIVVSEETRKKISMAGMGRVASIETRKKISQSNKGKRVSPETRKKISEAHKGKPSPQKGIKGKPRSEEKKLKMKKGFDAWIEKQKLGIIPQFRPCSKLKEHDVVFIRSDEGKKTPTKVLASKYSVSEQTIRVIRRGLKWKNVRTS